MIYLLPFLSYIASSKSVTARPPACPFDPDTMPNNALEVIASSSGPNGSMRHLQLYMAFRLNQSIGWVVRVLRF